MANVPPASVPVAPMVNVVDGTGAVRETLALNPAVFGARVDGALLHQAVVREQAGHRAGTHDTRGRSEVSGGGRKPWRQKGTGRARQGSIRATQWKGGGKPFGPTPRSYAKDLPRQARRAALRAALSDKVAGGRAVVVEGIALGESKTKALVRLLAGLGVAETPTLLVLVDPSSLVARASRNVPWLHTRGSEQVSVTDLLGHDRVVFERRALILLQETLLS